MGSYAAGRWGGGNGMMWWMRRSTDSVGEVKWRGRSILKKSSKFNPHSVLLKFDISRVSS